MTTIDRLYQVRAAQLLIDKRSLCRNRTSWGWPSSLMMTIEKLESPLSPRRGRRSSPTLVRGGKKSCLHL